LKKLKVAKVLSLVLVLPAGMVLVTLAVVNRGPVTIDFWPLPMDMQAPLSAMIMLSLIVGVIWGGVASWLAAGTGRKRARDTVQRANRAESETRDLKNRVARLESEVRDTKASAKTSNTPVGPPALPPANAA